MIYLSPRPEQNPVERASLSVRGEVYIRCELEEKRKRAVKRMNGGKGRERKRETRLGGVERVEEMEETSWWNEAGKSGKSG